ncbi:MAG: BlaI/MecI/CopY family transcriptional regulator [Bacteroidota bacterium]
MSLPKSEEEIMKHLWKLKKGFFKDIKNEYPDPKPATTTINTLLKRLIDKEYISYRVYGNSREYYPLVSKDTYFSNFFKKLISTHFDDSIEQFGSFFTKASNISEDDLKTLHRIVDNKLREGNHD